MRARLLLPFLFIAICCNSAIAQMVGTNTFLQGKWLEIGVQNNGAFGAQSVPAGYHMFPVGSGWLAETYDLGHDGWAAGVPPYNGDYTYPGSPFEGWELQVNGQRNQAFQGFTPGYGGGVPAGSLTGASVSYSNVGGRAIANWVGSAATGQLLIKQETRVDTLASWVVVTTYFKNNGVTPIPGIYYLRSCDPDNDQAHGGAFNTNNLIVHQNEDARHMVQVDATGLTYNDHFGLATKDCRAKAFIYTSWWISGSTDLASVWSGSSTGLGTAQFTINSTLNGDYGIGLVYNIGTLAGGDSAIISHAYYFNGLNGCDSAFPDPQIVVNGVPKVSYAPPTPNYDTLDVCNTGITSVPVDILNASDKCWTWSSWTWSPALGLASTTGVTNTITTGPLPPIITYTITGTDSATGMTSCNRKTFYLTILTCNGAISNSPCVGDTIFFNAPGDSSSAMYAWYGPNGFGTVKSTSQAWQKIPAALTDTGWWYVIKTVMGIPDTSKTHVVVHPLPIPTVTSNQGNCLPIVGTLNLSATTLEPMGTWAWTGPNGFTSTSAAPVIAPFDATGSGTYSVNVVSTFGCKASGVVNVHPAAIPIFSFHREPGCGADTVTLTNTSTNASTFVWTFKDGSAPVLMTTLNPPIRHVFTPPGGIYTVVLTASNLYCTDSSVQTIDSRHSITASMTARDPICLVLYTPGGPMADPLTPVNSSTATDVTGFSGTPVQPVRSIWNFGDGSGDQLSGGTTAPTYTYTASGTYPITVTVFDSIGCESSASAFVRVLEPTLHGVTDTTFCLTQPSALNTWVTLFPPIDTTEFGLRYVYAWSGAGVDNQYLDNDSVSSPYFQDGIGDYTLTLTTVLTDGAAVNCMATHQTIVHSRLPMQLTDITLSTGINYGGSVQLNAGGVLYYSWLPADGSLNDNNINNPIASPTVTTTYTVFGFDIYGCRDTASVTIHVDSTMTEFTPSGFTPNGDNLNDVFRARIGKYQKLVEFRIFNRWGQEIFVSNSIDKGWDGTFMGTPQDVGVYYYQIIASRPGNIDNVVYKGEVTLIR
jgi:gliding motility-associated-like protein